MKKANPAKPSAPRPAPSSPGGLQKWVMQGPIFLHGYSKKEADPLLPKDGVARCQIVSIEAGLSIPFAAPADL